MLRQQAPGFCWQKVLKSAPPVPPVLEGVVVPPLGVVWVVSGAEPPVPDGVGVAGAGATPPDDEVSGVAAGVVVTGGAVSVVAVEVVAVVADAEVVGVPPDGGAVSTGVVLGTS